MIVPRYYEDLDFLHEHTMPPRAYYIPASRRMEDLVEHREASDRVQMLNGMWKFRYFESIYDVRDAFYESGYDTSDFDEIPVPGVWQMAGYDTHQYTNFRYPFPFDPPYVPQDIPCGAYVHTFSYAKDKKAPKVYLNFEGVDSCFYVWVNGVYTGYSQVSHATSEFDVTDVIEEGENTIAVLVLKWCDGSYLEDQDKFRMSGIFRDVYLLKRPEKAVQEPKAAQLPQATEPEDDEPELTPEQRAAAERRKAEITRTVQVSIEQIEDAEAEQAEKEADTPESTDSKVGRAVRLLIGWLLLVVLLAGMIAAGGIYWLYKKATPDMIPAVTVTVEGQQLDPVAYHWQVPVAGNHLKRTYAETLSSTPTALESDFGGGTMTLRVTPADCSTEVTVKDENKQEVFSGSAQEFAAYRFTTPGSYTAKLVVSSGEGYQSEPTVSGHQTYEFTFDVTIKATVRLNTQAVTPGGVVAVKVTGQQTDTKPSLTAELPDTGFRASATGDGWVAYLAVPLETEPGSYTIKVTVDGEVQELTLNVSKSAASFRDYTSKFRLVTPYVGADDTPQEVLDLLDTASDTIYWADTGFASPFSDKVEVTLPYGLTEYVNRTQTERKNNTGTGRTSINVVLSGRCDLIAPAGGKVLLAEKLPNVGNTLVIEHGAGVKTIYYGLRRLTVEKGAIVAQGDALGTTDKATVVEVRVGKTPVEPLRILRGQCDALRSY